MPDQRPQLDRPQEQGGELAVDTSTVPVGERPDLAALQRRTAWVGVAASVLILCQVPLYFVYTGAPPDSNILTRTLIGLVGCTCYLVWFVGLRVLVERVTPVYAWVAGVMQAAGLVWVAIVFVPQSMEAGAAISVNHDIDTTIEGPYAAAQYRRSTSVTTPRTSTVHRAGEPPPPRVPCGACGPSR